MAESKAFEGPPELAELMATPDLPGLGPSPRVGRRPAAELESALDRFFASREASSEARQAVQSVVLLWHDHLEASHEISQSLRTSDGSFLHAIMHRREPDYGNSKYWFHRVGNHPVFPDLSSEALALREARRGGAWLREGVWDPFAFVDACQRAERGDETNAERQLLIEIQAAEFRLLFARFCAALR